MTLRSEVHIITPDLNQSGVYSFTEDSFSSDKLQDSLLDFGFAGCFFHRKTISWDKVLVLLLIPAFPSVFGKTDFFFSIVSKNLNDSLKQVLMRFCIITLLGHTKYKNAYGPIPAGITISLCGIALYHRDHRKRVDLIIFRFLNSVSLNSLC